MFYLIFIFFSIKLPFEQHLVHLHHLSFRKPVLIFDKETLDGIFIKLFHRCRYIINQVGSKHQINVIGGFKALKKFQRRPEIQFHYFFFSRKRLSQFWLNFLINKIQDKTKLTTYIVECVLRKTRRAEFQNLKGSLSAFLEFFDKLEFFSNN